MDWRGLLGGWARPAPPPPPPTPAGPAPLSPELLRKVRAIQIRARQQVTDLMAGEYTSAFKGRGMEFEEVREYVPGDDIRSIDWNVTARLGHPYIKVFREERELTVMLLVDISSSGEFGTLGRQKIELAAELAAVLAYTAIRSNDKVGLVLFSDRVEHFIPPKKGRAHVWRVIREVLSSRETYGSRPQRPTNVACALELVSRVVHRRSICFLLSDFQDQGWHRPVAITAGRHEVIALALDDRHERTLPDIGFVELMDAETGERLVVDTSDAQVRAAFESQVRLERRQRTDALRALEVDHIAIATDEDLVGPLLRFFAAREVRR